MTHAAAQPTPYRVPRASRHAAGHRSLGTAFRGWVARNLVGDDPYADVPSYLDRLDQPTHATIRVATPWQS